MIGNLCWNLHKVRIVWSAIRENRLHRRSCRCMNMRFVLLHTGVVHKFNNRPRSRVSDHGYSWSSTNRYNNYTAGLYYIIAASSVKYQTIQSLPAVLGPVSPDSLGVILPHEHLLVDMTAFITQPNYGPSLTDLEMTSLSNMGKIRQYP